MSNYTCQEEADYYESHEEPPPPPEPNCLRCNDNGCPACDEKRKGDKHNPDPL